MSKENPQIGDRYYWNGFSKYWCTLVKKHPNGDFEYQIDGEDGPPKTAAPKADMALWPGDPGCPPDPKAKEHQQTFNSNSTRDIYCVCGGPSKTVQYPFPHCVTTYLICTECKNEKK